MMTVEDVTYTKWAGPCRHTSISPDQRVRQNAHQADARRNAEVEDRVALWYRQPPDLSEQTSTHAPKTS